MAWRDRFAPVFVLIAIVAAVAIAGCGSSDKPEYCSKTDDLKGAVDKLKSDVTSANIENIKSDASTVQSDASAVVSAAKQDFPTQTTSLEASVSSLSSAVKDLPDSPSAQEVLKLAPYVASAASAVQAFADETQSECD
jgi:outer membrane murein-binding lipoprotein Lpp